MKQQSDIRTWISDTGDKQNVSGSTNKRKDVAVTEQSIADNVAEDEGWAVRPKRVRERSTMPRSSWQTKLRSRSSFDDADDEKHSKLWTDVFLRLPPLFN